MAPVEKICPIMSLETFGPGQSFGSCGLVHESP